MKALFLQPPALALRLIAVAFAVATERSAIGAERPDSIIVQPATYESPNRSYLLRVEPRQRMGLSGARHKLTRDGKTQWHGEKPYTLRAVSLANDGVAAGIAYCSVPKEIDGKPGYRDESLHVLIVNEKGKERVDDSVARENIPDMGAEPHVEQLIADSQHDFLVVRVVGLFGSEWWTYRLSTGKVLDKFDPRQHLTGKQASGTRKTEYVVDFASVPGTPLILVHWYTKGPNFKTRDDGARFSVVGVDGKPIWTIDAKNDYADVTFARFPFGGGPSEYFREHPAILSLNKPGEFAVRLFAENKTVKFGVTKNTDGNWQVSEHSRTEYKSPVSSEAIEKPSGSLKFLGELVLGATAEGSSSFGRIRNFTFDKNGQLCLLSTENDRDTSVVVLDEKERPVRKFPLPKGGEIRWADTTRLSTNLFTSIGRTAEERAISEVSLIDLATGKKTAFSHLPGPHVDSIVRFANGGFIVGRKEIDPHGSMQATLVCCDAAGAVQWQKSTNVNYISITSDQRIIALDFGRVQIISRDGGIEKNIDLKGAFGSAEFGGRPGYLHEVVADADGGFLIANFATPPVVIRYDRKGDLRSRWSPRHPDGMTFDIFGKVRVASDGRIWTTDGRNVFRLTDDGVVDRTVGDPKKVDRLENIAGLTVDQNHNIYAVAQSDGAVHIFDSTGKPLRVLKPDPTDIPGSMKDAFVAVTDLGDIFVQRPATKVFMPPQEYLHFDSKGNRVGIVTFSRRMMTRKFGPGWAFLPRTRYRCGFSVENFGADESLYISDPNDKSIRKIEKRPNGKWFSNPVALAVAPDGRIASLDVEITEKRGNHELDIFSSSGDPIRTILVPKTGQRFTALAFDGIRVVIASAKEVIIVLAADGTMSRWTLTEPAVETVRWSAYITSRGKELLLVDDFEMLTARGGKRTIHRYSLP